MELYCQAIEEAAETWKTVKSLTDYETLVGKLLFQQIFAIAPEALSLYSFSESKDVETVFQSTAFVNHSIGVVRTLELVLVMMLGDDMDGLAEALQSLGRRHITYGVHTSHYSIVETALLRTLQSALQPAGKWTEDARKGWAAVFKFVAKSMMTGVKVEIVKNNSKRDVVVDEESYKSATMRLQLIYSSSGTSKLSRSGMSRRSYTSNRVGSSFTKDRKPQRRHSDPINLRRRRKRNRKRSVRSNRSLSEFRRNSFLDGQDCDSYSSNDDFISSLIPINIIFENHRVANDDDSSRREGLSRCSSTSVCSSNRFDENNNNKKCNVDKKIGIPCRTRSNEFEESVKSDKKIRLPFIRRWVEYDESIKSDKKIAKPCRRRSQDCDDFIKSDDVVLPTNIVILQQPCGNHALKMDMSDLPPPLPRRRHTNEDDIHDDEDSFSTLAESLDAMEYWNDDDVLVDCCQ